MSGSISEEERIALEHRASAASFDNVNLKLHASYNGGEIKGLPIRMFITGGERPDVSVTKALMGFLKGNEPMSDDDIDLIVQENWRLREVKNAQ